MKQKQFPVHLSRQRTVTAEHLIAQTGELLKAVNRDNEAIFVRNDEDFAVLVPYWWYMNNHGSNVQMIVEYLFEECRNQSSENADFNLTIANGYFSHVSRLIGHEIRTALMEKMEGHAHAKQWQDLLDGWTRKWKENNTPELWLVMAKFAGDCKLYLLYQNGTTRLMDGRQLIGRGLKADDLEDEGAFYSRLSMTSGALLWNSEEGQIQLAVSSDELLELSTPVDPGEANTIWNPQRIRA